MTWTPEERRRIGLAVLAAREAGKNDTDAAADAARDVMVERGGAMSAQDIREYEALYPTARRIVEHSTFQGATVATLQASLRSFAQSETAWQKERSLLQAKVAELEKEQIAPRIGQDMLVHVERERDAASAEAERLRGELEDAREDVATNQRVIAEEVEKRMAAESRLANACRPHRFVGAPPRCIGCGEYDEAAINRDHEEARFRSALGEATEAARRQTQRAEAEMLGRISAESRLAAIRERAESERVHIEASSTNLTTALHWVLEGDVSSPPGILEGSTNPSITSKGSGDASKAPLCERCDRGNDAARCTCTDPEHYLCPPTITHDEETKPDSPGLSVNDQEHGEADDLKSTLAMMTDLRDAYRKAGMLEHERANAAEAEVERLWCESWGAAVLVQACREDVATRSESLESRLRSAHANASDWSRMYEAATQRAEQWRRRVEDAADALADVLPGEVGRLNLLARIDALKGQRDEALARLKPSGQVAEDDDLLRDLIGRFHENAPHLLDALHRLAAKAQGYEAAVTANAALVRAVRDAKAAKSWQDADACLSVVLIAPYPGTALLDERHEREQAVNPFLELARDRLARRSYEPIPQDACTRLLKAFNAGEEKDNG